MAEAGPENIVITEANNNTSSSPESEDDFTIGEPESEDFDIQASVCFSHRYFKKIAGTETAVCLTCRRANNKKGPRDIKKKDTFSTAGGSTAGNVLINLMFIFNFLIQDVDLTSLADTRDLSWTSILRQTRGWRR